MYQHNINPLYIKIMNLFMDTMNINYYFLILYNNFLNKVNYHYILLFNFHYITMYIIHNHQNINYLKYITNLNIVLHIINYFLLIKCILLGKKLNIN